MRDALSFCRGFPEAMPRDFAIKPLPGDLLAEAQAHLDSLAKPQGSLGRLEEIACRLSAMFTPPRVSPAIMFTVAGDHGVARENVSPFPQQVTRQMVENFLHHGAGINALTRAVGMDLAIVDAGCAGGPFSASEVLDRHLGNGTADFTKGPAMSRETCLAGLRSGVDLVLDYAGQGYRCFAIGEMGIANSTSAAALYSHLLGVSPDAAVGPGTGADPVMIAHKADVVRRGLFVNRRALDERLASGMPDPVAALTCLGGFEIVLMAGIVLGAASLGLPVLVDGFIASSAYAAACLLYPAAADYAFVSHSSAEPGHAPAMALLAGRTPHPEWGRPLLSLGLRLGEGTGAAAAYPLLRCACAIYTDMASFDDACGPQPDEDNPAGGK